MLYFILLVVFILHTYHTGEAQYNFIRLFFVSESDIYFYKIVIIIFGTH